MHLSTNACQALVADVASQKPVVSVHLFVFKPL